MTVKKMLKKLRSESIKTWFDLGIFIDRFRENRKIPTAEFLGFYEDFREFIKLGGIAFITFDYGIDGVTIEICKYARCLRKLFKNIPIHFIAGNFYPEGNHLIDPCYRKFELKDIKSFNNWHLYEDFFLTKLERGSTKYNELIFKYWNEVLDLTEKLGNYIEKNNIKILFPVNICSNPGNVSLTLAIVFISEFLGIPVINNNHDFYWEGGNKEIDIINKGLKPGPRDFFFTNSDIGEFFSIIDILFPWESRSWISVNINKNQSKHVIEINGHNPSNVCEISTSVDIKLYQNVPKQAKTDAFIQIKDILSGYKKNLTTHTPKQILKIISTFSKSINPFLLGSKELKFRDFEKNNIIFLQPTRIMRRKRIEKGFELIKKLFENKEFALKFKQNSFLYLTILITGPIALSHFSYFKELIQCFSDLLIELKDKHRERVFLGFLFSEFDKKRFIKKYKIPITLPELYNISSLILLPSETEGRGLPIIEATACGVPIFVNRYYPTSVYDAVVGKHLEEKDRLKVLEFKEEYINNEIVKKMSEWIFFPQKFIKVIKHNHEVVERRYSMEALENKLEDIISRLYNQLKPNHYSIQRIANTIDEYKKTISLKSKELSKLLNTEKRHYLPGYGRLSFMLFLKSLIDPSYFRIEEQRIRGMAMQYALRLISESIGLIENNKSKINRFYNNVDAIFSYHKGEFSIRHDHSIAYRHRNKNYYPYQDLTFQELSGLINMLFYKIFTPKSPPVFGDVPPLFKNLNLALYQLTNSSTLVIDDREKLIEKLKKNIPLAIFPNQFIKYELDLFALHHIFAQLDLSHDEILNEELILKKKSSIAPTFIFCPEKPIGKRFTAKAIKSFIKKSSDEELQLLYKHKLICIIRTKQWGVGIHFPQLGKDALKVLCQIQQQKGFIISCLPHSPMMTDIVDIDKFHIGCIEEELSSKIMGIPVGSGYIQFVPAGVRTTLSYPTPIQTSLDFSKLIKSEQYRILSKKLGEEKLLALIKEDAQTKGSPIEVILSDILKGKEKYNEDVTYSYISGIYKDNLPWNGVLANVNINQSGKKWSFAIISDKRKKKVTEFIQKFEETYKKNIKIAWNGGYMLNAELVGKLGLPETYIGSPLGLIISDNKVISPPLFNKPAFLIHKDGKLDIKKVNCRNGFSIFDNHKIFEFYQEHYNLSKPKENDICFYDLFNNEEIIYGRGRIILRLAGNVIKDIIYTKKNQDIPTIPVGLVLSFPKHLFPSEWEKKGKQLNFKIRGFENIENAIEAGPLLVKNSKCCIDMEIEGWKAINSIKTQAARLDFVDMRGPKIAIGLDNAGNLSVLTINGRIRESVGATHIDMAQIMIDQGMVKSMGFDPGGSSTLFACGKVLNISPFNSEYEKDVLSLPPEPRPVGNAVIGWQEE